MSFYKFAAVFIFQQEGVAWLRYYKKHRQIQYFDLTCYAGLTMYYHIRSLVMLD